MFDAVTNIVIFSTEFYTNHMAEKQQNIDGIVKTIDEGFELLQFHDDLLQLVDCLLHFNICVESVKELQSYHHLLQKDLETISLARVTDWLAALHALIPGMPSSYMQYFHAVFVGNEVLTTFHFCNLKLIHFII